MCKRGADGNGLALFSQLDLIRICMDSQKQHKMFCAPCRFQHEGAGTEAPSHAVSY